MRNNLKLTTVLIVIHLLSVKANCQEIKKTLYGQFKEKYSVSTSNKEVKDGPYAVYNNRELVIKGNYSNNQKSGLWTVYSSKQDTEFVYNYDLNKFKYWKCQENFQGCNDKKRPAYCADGFQIIYSQILMDVIYPQSAQLESKQGSSTVTIVIDRDGRFHDFYLSKSSGNIDIDKEAVIAVRNICSKSTWFPAVDYNDNPIDDKIKFTINFILK
jgi:TonB family protein